MVTTIERGKPVATYNTFGSPARIRERRNSCCACGDVVSIATDALKLGARKKIESVDRELIAACAEPTIADAHTSPGGADLGDPKVLYVATGLPRSMVVTIDTCQGPRAYAGLAFAYHEVTTKLERLTDKQWADRAMSAPDVPWITPILQ